MATIQERLRAIDEEKMYQEPATTFATCQEAADRIDALEAALKAVRSEMDSDRLGGWKAHNIRAFITNVLPEQ